GSTPATPAAPTTELSLAAPTVVFRPAEPGWRLVYLGRSRWTSGAHTSFAFSHSDGRRFEVALYPSGARTPGSALRADERLTVRGRPAFATDEGPPRYRVDWDEAGRQWEADGAPFMSLDAFAATLDGLEVVDRATWDAWLPAELAAALREHPDETVSWYDGRGVSIQPAASPDGRGVVSMPYQPG